MKRLALAIAVAAVMTGSALAQAMLPYKSDWQTLEASNGAVYKYDQKSISHLNNGTAELIVYVVEGDAYIPTNLRRLWFDCKGRYRDLANVMAPTQYAAPRSVAGQLSVIACAGARDARFDEPPKGTPRPEPQWQDFCKGFSPDACMRMRKVVEAKVTPSYCKPGFGVVPTSLSDEQLRICYTMVSLDEAPKAAQRAAASPAQPPRADDDGDKAQKARVALSYLDCDGDITIRNGRIGLYLGGRFVADTILGATYVGTVYVWGGEDKRYTLRYSDDLTTATMTATNGGSVQVKCRPAPSAPKQP